MSAERELARECGVAYDTVQRAAVLLRERGLIITVHGQAPTWPMGFLWWRGVQPNNWSITSAPRRNSGTITFR